jgi:GTP-binding protein
MRAIDRADIALLVADATEPVTAQDTHIAGYVEKAGKGIIILVNKWDLAEEKNKSTYNEYIESQMKFASYAPILYISRSGGGKQDNAPQSLGAREVNASRTPVNT